MNKIATSLVQKAFMRVTGMSLADLGRVYGFHYFVTRSTIRSYWRTLQARNQLAVA